jgi:hypothetical protein
MSIENILTRGVERREFLKGSGKAALGLAGLLNACATTAQKETTADLRETAPVAYQTLPGDKVQPAKEGCMVGFFRLSAYFGQPVPYPSEEYYYDHLGRKPSILVALNQQLPYFFPAGQGEKWGKQGIIPFIYAKLDPYQIQGILKGKENFHLGRVGPRELPEILKEWHGKMPYFGA